MATRLFAVRDALQIKNSPAVPHLLRRCFGYVRGLDGSAENPLYLVDIKVGIRNRISPTLTLPEAWLAPITPDARARFSYLWEKSLLHRSDCSEQAVTRAQDQLSEVWGRMEAIQSAITDIPNGTLVPPRDFWFVKSPEDMQRVWSVSGALTEAIQRSLMMESDAFQTALILLRDAETRFVGEGDEIHA